MISITVLDSIDQSALDCVVAGYHTDSIYAVQWSDNGEQSSFSLTLSKRTHPYHKSFAPLDNETIDRYSAALPAGYSFGAFDDEQLVGVILAEPHFWNQSVWVSEFHVAVTQRRQGIGRRLMDALAKKALSAGLRTLVCETQNTNVPAIQAYRRLNFQLEGIDISYYSNHDYPAGEIAVFMKRRLE
jgi:ribosomal protein S18 acetylase RimI-like enzyme